MKTAPRSSAIKQKGWLKAHYWIIMRRASQIIFLLIFGICTWLGIGLVQGSLTASEWLWFIPATEPLTFFQSIATFKEPAIDLIIGGIILLILGLIFGARLFCGWICPVNFVAEFTGWIKFKLGLKGNIKLGGNIRYGILGAILIASTIGQFLAWEVISPISNTYRALLFAGFSGLWLLFFVVILDLFVLSDNFCKSLCPQGALYALIGHFRIFGISAKNKDQCTNCGDCYAVCPEKKILHEPLRGTSTNHVKSGLCTGCAQCIDVCCENVFNYDFFIPTIPKAKKEKTQ